LIEITYKSLDKERESMRMRIRTKGVKWAPH